MNPRAKAGWGKTLLDTVCTHSFHLHYLKSKRKQLSSPLLPYSSPFGTREPEPRRELLGSRGWWCSCSAAPTAGSWRTSRWPLRQSAGPLGLEGQERGGKGRRGGAAALSPSLSLSVKGVGRVLLRGREEGRERKRERCFRGPVEVNSARGAGGNLRRRTTEESGAWSHTMS